MNKITCFFLLQNKHIVVSSLIQNEKDIVIYVDENARTLRVNSGENVHYIHGYLLNSKICVKLCKRNLQTFVLTSIACNKTNVDIQILRLFTVYLISRLFVHPCPISRCYGRYND